MSYSIRRPEGLHLFKTPGSTPATWFHLWRHLPLLGSTPQSWSSSPSLGTKTPGNVGETTPLDQQSCLERDQQTPEIRKISFPKMSQMPHWEMEWHEARLVLQRRHEAWIFDISWNVYSQSKQTSVVFGKSLEESTQHLQSEMVPFCTSLGDSPNQHFLKNNNPNETVDEHQFRKGSLHTCRSTRCGHPPWWELHCTADIAGVESASHTVHPARWKKTDLRDTNKKRVLKLARQNFLSNTFWWIFHTFTNLSKKPCGYVFSPWLCMKFLNTLHPHPSVASEQESPP